MIDEAEEGHREGAQEIPMRLGTDKYGLLFAEKKWIDASGCTTGFEG